MKPDKIIILRHGQSLGNVDKSVYNTTPDYALPLSDNGRKQAITAGEALKQVLVPGGIQCYASPYWRTRQTLEIVLHRLMRPAKVYEDPRLREQEWSGDFRKETSPDEYDAVEEKRDAYGHFYYSIQGGESCADVFDRVSDFMGTMFRDFENRDYPRNALISGHGMTNRLFLMRFFHMTVEDFELLANPLNCEFYVLARNLDNDRYTLATCPRHHKLKHKFQYKPLYPNVPISPFDGGRITQAADSRLRYLGYAALMWFTVVVGEPGMLLLWILVLSDMDWPDRKKITWMQAVLAIMLLLRALNVGKQKWANIFDCLFSGFVVLIHWGAWKYREHKTLERLDAMPEAELACTVADAKLKVAANEAKLDHRQMPGVYDRLTWGLLWVVLILIQVWVMRTEMLLAK